MIHSLLVQNPTTLYAVNTKILYKICTPSVHLLSHYIQFPGSLRGRSSVFCPVPSNQEIARLDKEGRRTRTELFKITDKAEGLREEVNGKLDRLADHMLKIPP